MYLKFINIIPPILLFANACASSASITTIKRGDGLTNLISHEGNFSALMPEKPRRSVKKTASKMGELKNYIYSCYVENQGRDSYFYLVSYVDYPDRLIQTINGRVLIRNTVSGSMSRFKEARLIKEKILSLDDHPGHEAIFTGYQTNTDKLIMAKERIYLVNNRMYILLMVTEAFNSYDIADRFFNSFQLTTNL